MTKTKRVKFTYRAMMDIYWDIHWYQYFKSRHAAEIDWQWRIREARHLLEAS